MCGVDDTEQGEANPNEVGKQNKKELEQTNKDKFNGPQSEDELETTLLKQLNKDLIGNRHKYIYTMVYIVYIHNVIIHQLD